jgi:hypothetical protein
MTTVLRLLPTLAPRQCFALHHVIGDDYANWSLWQHYIVTKSKLLYFCQARSVSSEPWDSGPDVAPFADLTHPTNRHRWAVPLELYDADALAAVIALNPHWLLETLERNAS